MQEVYVSSMSNDEWGDKLNDSTISNGKTITLSNSTLVDGVGASVNFTDYIIFNDIFQHIRGKPCT